jgi:hypothetical protein
MSICLRDGVRYNRHVFESKGLASNLVCKHCNHIKGTTGVIFESGSQEGAVEGDSSGVAEVHEE